MSDVAPWAWRVLDADMARDTWSALSSFVDWLVARYDLGDFVPACWWAHGAITEELTALWAAWTASYLDAQASPDAPLTWHERFAQCRLRITEWDRLGCAQRGHRDGGACDWKVADGFDAFVASDCVSRTGAHRLDEHTPEPDDA